MKIARFWKRAGIVINGPGGKPMDAVAWGWSETDPAEAQQKADEAVKRVAERIASGQSFPDSYGYPDRPAREEILNELRNEEGEIIAFTSRNSYGSVVLNTAKLMFIDIDVPPPTPLGLVGSIMKLFGSKQCDRFDNELAKIREKANSRPDLTFRVYRTAAGFRLAVTNKRIDPTSSESTELLSLFGSDPLYVRLCKNQASFRARLSPKHWRCNAESPRGRYPFADACYEGIYRNWLTEYNTAAADFATCRFIEQIGTQTSVADFRRLIELHDRETKAETGVRQPLA